MERSGTEPPGAEPRGRYPRRDLSLSALVGVILTGHDGRRGLIHHLCVHPDCRRAGVAARLVAAAEEALRQEGIQKIFCLVFRDNDAGNAFWERQGYSLRTNLNYRNKSLNPAIPRGD